MIVSSVVVAKRGMSSFRIVPFMSMATEIQAVNMEKLIKSLPLFGTLLQKVKTEEKYTSFSS